MRYPFTTACIAIFTSIFLQASAFPQVPAEAKASWIWSKKPAGRNEKAFLRADFDLATLPEKVVIRWTCDNKAQVVINGKSLGKSENWEAPSSVRLAKEDLKVGRNWLAAVVENEGAGAAGFLLQVEDVSQKNAKVIFRSGSAWRWQADAPADWQSAPADIGAMSPVVELGVEGISPWGELFSSKGGSQERKIKAPEGFVVEEVYNVPKAEQGSWVSLTVDNNGNFIAGDQDGKVYRLTLPKTPDDDPTVQELTIKAGHAQGLLWHKNALYVVVNGGNSGLYKCTDANGDGQFEEEKLLKKFEGGGEHGPHQVVLGPSGDSLIVAGGNHTKLPSVEGHLVPPLWQEDLLLPRMWDANGHAVNIFAPGGWFCETDLEAKNWKVYSMGFRNQYDIAFSPTGEGFTYDSDMEWDVGMPWYRPTRINHVTPGSEHGWRSGSGVWPDYYFDSLNPVVNIGPGSPTGVAFGTGAKFPEKYQRALYAADWTYGTLYAIHLTPDGSGYTGEKEAFITGKPLPLSDLVVHPDGNMYFLVGGRKVQSTLFRVRYDGKESTAAAGSVAPNRYAKQRHELEAYLAAPRSPQAVDAAFRYLGNKDRLLRYTARSVLEHQPLELWQEKAFAEKAAPNSTIDAMVALCRVGKPELQGRILETLRSVHDQGLREGEMMDLLRTYSLCFIRLGKPQDPSLLRSLREQFEPMYPSPSTIFNKEVAELLVYLDSKQIVGKLLQSMQSAAEDVQDASLGSEQLELNAGYADAFKAAKSSRPNRQQIQAAYALQYAKEGWSPELRKSLFRWFNTALQWNGGHSFKGFLKNMRKTALENVPAAERVELEQLSDKFLATSKPLPTPKGPGKAYDLEALTSLAAPDKLKGRDLAHGKEMYQAALCASCHQMKGEFGGVGPDITGAAERYSIKDLLENIVQPSKVISDQYGSTLFELNDGSSVVGRVVAEDGGVIKVVQNPLQPESTVDVKSADIKTRSLYPVSAMPPALLNNLNESEVLDLVAYILAGGKTE
jgi:putative heme-binding domain-containing protein